MFQNKVKKILQKGGTAIGTMITEFRSPEVIRILAAAGMDFVFIDGEHSSYDRVDILEMIRGGKASDITCLVRVADSEYHLIAGTLDSGAQGIMVPRIETREQVEKIVSYSKYPPVGVRGYGPRGIITDYEKLKTADWIETINEQVLIVLQIEKRKAVDSIEDLLTVDEVDAALIGPQDLSISLGIPGEQHNPKFIEAVQKVVDACEKQDLASGIHVRDIKDLLFWKKRGMRLLTYSTDSRLLMASAASATREIRNG